MTHEQMTQHREELEAEIRRLLIEFKEKTGLTPVNVNIETHSIHSLAHPRKLQISRVEVVAQL
jgi:hypothetical protein